MTIKDFIDNNDNFDCYKFCCEWKGYNVYDIWLKANEGACTGYPEFALSDVKNKTVRQATFEEALEIMSFTSADDDEASA